ncbi:UNVERIFIED_CONTAM: hypothetical protein GTU68_037644 [Idotea baltica]|nr:hypothetical protein [Idotea baltica]
MHEINGARCLDLFAGTGALGFESLSRGAAFVQFVESNKVAVDNLQDNINVLSKAKEMFAQVTHQSALDFLTKQPAEPYNIVYIDPPFQSTLLSQSIELLIANSWLSDGSFIYLEHDVNTRLDLNLIPATWTLYRKGSAGKSAYYLYIA